MADSAIETSTSTAPEDKTMTNGNKDNSDQAPAPAVKQDAEVAEDTTGHTEDVKAVETGDDIAESKGATERADDHSNNRKRKHSPADDRDWRARREDFQRNRSGSRDRRGGSHRGSRGGGRGGFRGGHRQNYSANIKTKYEDQPESDDPDEIRKQVEFYFSDSNLFTDNFLLNKVGGSENKPVPIKILHSFKRMRHFQPYSAIVAALKDSTVLDVTEDEEVVRKKPLPENISTEDLDANLDIMEDHTRSRSIYAKGFGEEGPTTQFDIEAFFAPYGPTNAIRLRRTYPDKIFKGSVFVEFDSDETAKQFLDLETKPKWNEKELEIKSKEDYVKSKARDVRDGKIKGSAYRGNKGRGNGRGGRGHHDGRGGRGRGKGRDDRGPRRDRDDRGSKRGERRDRDFRDSRRKSHSPAQEDDGEPQAKQDVADTKDAPAIVDATVESKDPEESKKRKLENDGVSKDADDKEAKKAKVEGDE